MSCKISAYRISAKIQYRASLIPWVNLYNILFQKIHGEPSELPRLPITRDFGVVFSGPGNVSVALLSMQGQTALGFHQKYLSLCSKDEQRSYGFRTT